MKIKYVSIENHTKELKESLAKEKRYLRVADGERTISECLQKIKSIESELIKRGVTL